MFERFEIGSRISKTEYSDAVPDLRVRLLNAQFDLRKADFPVVLLLAGDDYRGVDELLDVLHEWLDARYIDTEVFLRPTDAEQGRPLFFRYWQALPPRGKIAIHVGAWAVGAVRAEVLDEDSAEERATRIRHIRGFERALVDDGALLQKVWVHLSPEEHERRAENRQTSSQDPSERDASRWIWQRGDAAIRAAENFIAKTDTAGAPWRIVEGSQDRHRNLSVARALVESLEARLHGSSTPASVPATSAAPVPDVLESVDLEVRLGRKKYRDRLEVLQDRLRKLARNARNAGVSTVLVFEGWDAAGKGGCIRRITRPLEARDYRVVPIAAPDEAERAHHYLWRFWRELPRAGRILIFDRSWYGRVLVERVEGFASEAEWQRAYEEIRDFEDQLTESGAALAKFWLQIDPGEQLRRFQAREQTPYKKYKITEEDYRNRDRWEDYAAAVNEMVARTASESAPWHVVAANDKRYARVRILDETCDALERALERA